MLSSLHLPPRSTLRQFVAVAALLGQVVAAVGAPVPSRASAANGTPFPCLGHPCGCSTSDQGWAGDCCCFTLEEKLAWADARGIEPPPHVRPAVAARKLTKAAKSCCAPSKGACCEHEAPVSGPREAKAGVTWVAGVFAQKCRGEGFGGLLKLELVAAPDVGPSHFATDRPELSRAPDTRVVVVSSPPPEPPPRFV